MAHFYTYETVEIPLIFTPNGILDGYSRVVVSVAQDDRIQIDKTEEDLSIDTTTNTITLSLTQQETAKFKGGTLNTPRKAHVQVNIYYNNSSRDVSVMKDIDVYDNLYKKVMSNES